MKEEKILDLLDSTRTQEKVILGVREYLLAELTLEKLERIVALLDKAAFEVEPKAEEAAEKYKQNSLSFKLSPKIAKKIPLKILFSGKLWQELLPVIFGEPFSDEEVKSVTFKQLKNLISIIWRQNFCPQSLPEAVQQNFLQILEFLTENKVITKAI